MDFALVEPARAYKGEIYGGTPLDVITVGSHRPSKEAVIIAPQAEIEALKKRNATYKGFYYAYPPSMTLREAVENILNGLGAFYVEPSEKEDVLGCPKRPIWGPWTNEQKAILRKEGVQQNLHSPSFFPGLEFGSHARSPFGIMEDSLYALMLPFTRPYVSAGVEAPVFPPTAHEVVFIEHSWTIFLQEMVKHIPRFNHSTQQYLKTWFTDMRSWFLLSKEDALLRLKHQRSIFQDRKLLGDILDERLKVKERMLNGRSSDSVLSSSLRERVLGSEPFHTFMGTDEITTSYLKLLANLAGGNVMTTMLRRPRDFVVSLLSDVELFTGDKEFILYCFLWRACRMDLLSAEEHVDSCVEVQLRYERGVPIRDPGVYSTLFSGWCHLAEAFSRVPGNPSFYDLLNFNGVGMVFTKVLNLPTDSQGKISLYTAQTIAKSEEFQFKDEERIPLFNREQMQGLFMPK